MYDQNFIRSLQDKVVLSDVIGRSIKVMNRGRNKVALCPFHKEKTPSFYINDEKGVYHCFGCGAHGNAINFVMQQEGLSFKEAIEKLANENGIELPKLEYNKQHTKEEINIIDTIYDINEKTCKYFQDCILSNIGKSGLNYIQKRGLSIENIKKFKIGFAPNDFSGLLNYLNNCGFNNKQLELAGVIVNKNDKYYDKFRNRVMFPVLDKKGKVIAFTGRVINKDELPKYMNSPETPIYHKSNVLFNYYFARKSIYDNKFVLLVEGNLDAISLSIYGVENVVAPMGTAITINQIEELWKITDEIIVCLDGDSAGQKASLRLATIVLPILTPIKNMKFVFLPTDQDPDDFIKQYGKNGFIEYIKNSDNCLSLSEFLWKNELNSLNISLNNKYITAEEKSSLEAKLDNISKQITNQIVSKNFKNFYKNQIFLITKYTGSKKAINYRNITKIDYKQNTKPINSIELLKQNILNIEKNMFYIMINYLQVIDQIFQNYNIDMFNMNYLDDDSIKLIDIFLKLYETNNINDKENLINILEKNDFNDYIIGSKVYNNILDEKKVKYLYSLVLERNICSLEIEIKNLSFKNDNEIKRKSIIQELELLQKKKLDLDENL